MEVEDADLVRVAGRVDGLHEATRRGPRPEEHVREPVRLHGHLPRVEDRADLRVRKQVGEVQGRRGEQHQDHGAPGRGEHGRRELALPRSEGEAARPARLSRTREVPALPRVGEVRAEEGMVAPAETDAPT